MQSSTNRNVLTAKGDSCHPQTSWLRTQSPKPSATGILEAQGEVGMESARAMADEQRSPQSVQPLQHMEQAQTALPNPPSLPSQAAPSPAPAGCVGIAPRRRQEQGIPNLMYSRYFIIIIGRGK